MIYKTQLSHIIQSKRSFDRRLGPIMKVSLLSMKNKLRPLPKQIFVQLGLIAAAAAAAADMEIHEDVLGSTILNEEMEHIIKIVRCLENFGFWVKGITQTIENELKKQQQGEFLGKLWGTSDLSLLENMLAKKGLMELSEEIKEQLDTKIFRY